MLSSADLLGLDARSPIALRHTILGAADEDALVRAAGQLRTLFLLLMRAGSRPRELGRVLSLQYDAITARLIDFSIWRQRAPAPVAWAWLDLGSAARREFTLASDQDNALAYANARAGRTPRRSTRTSSAWGPTSTRASSVAGSASTTTACWPAGGCGGCQPDGWLRTFAECLTEPDESHLIRASVSFDFRPSAGGLSVVPELTGYIRDARRTIPSSCG